MTFAQDIENLVSSRVVGIKSGKAKKALIMDVLYPGKEKASDQEKISREIERYRAVVEKIRPRIKDLKKTITHITDQTLSCAIYLIYAKILKTWEAVFLLAVAGNSYEIMELNRSIYESSSLAETFILEKDGKHLEKWFKGEIIKNRVARDLTNELTAPLRAELDDGSLKTEKFGADIYSAFSLYQHCSYAAILDYVDVFNEDFDWNGYAGAHYTLDALKKSSDPTMMGMLVSLKMAYRKLGDEEGFKETNNILVSAFGDMNMASLQESITKIRQDRKISKIKG